MRVDSNNAWVAAMGVEAGKNSLDLTAEIEGALTGGVGDPFAAGWIGGVGGGARQGSPDCLG